MSRRKLLDQIRSELSDSGREAALPLFMAAAAVTGQVAEDPGVQAGELPTIAATPVLSRPDRTHWLTDPRPDLVEDSTLWTALLARTYDQDGSDPAGVFGALRAARCCGARLVQGVRGLRIEPGDWDGDAGWPAEREWLLVPHTTGIKRLLTGVRADSNGNGS
jgi:hypothetical protein